MKSIKQYFLGIFVCSIVAVIAWFLGTIFPVIGAPVFSIVIGMVLMRIIRKHDAAQPGIQFTSKKILQYAVILLGFGMNFSVVLEIGKKSLPIILATITVSLLVAYLLHKALHIPGKISVLVGVGSAICGGSAIAATAPVINADNREVAQSISVIFFFNILAAVIFPGFGAMLGFSSVSGEPFGIFAGTAINDTSSVTAAASTWDSIYNLGTETLDIAVTVKLTRTLAIIPITLLLAFYLTHKARGKGNSVNFRKIFPFFILWFVLASVLTTILISFGVSSDIFSPLKAVSKFFIVMAMAAIGFNTDIIRLIKTGGKPLVIGFCCWLSITGVSLLIQSLSGIW